MLLSMPESLEAITVQKVQKCHFEILQFFFFSFCKNAHRLRKNDFQTSNKGASCFKYYEFLNFDEKKPPQNILVPWSFKLA